MTDITNILTENRRLNGYTLKVMDDWGSKVKNRFLSEKEKEQYLRDFGTEMITDTQFYEWWRKLK